MIDSFDKQTAEIGHVDSLRIIFTVKEGEPNTYTAEYDFLIPAMDHRHGDLIPKLTAAKRTAQKALLDHYLTLAQKAGS